MVSINLRLVMACLFWIEGMPLWLPCCGWVAVDGGREIYVLNIAMLPCHGLWESSKMVLGNLEFLDRKYFL